MASYCPHSMCSGEVREREGERGGGDRREGEREKEKKKKSNHIIILTAFHYAMEHDIVLF